MHNINWQKIIQGKTAVFIDAANILYSQKTLKFKIDYKKLKDYLSANLETVGFYYYTGKVGSLEKQLKFIKRLEGMGYHVTAKEVKFIKTQNGREEPKGDLDIELALDAFRFSDQYDTLILCSGDSDFAYLVDLLKEKHKRIITLSTRGHISRELIERTKYIDLRKLKSFIKFENKKIRSWPEGHS